MSIEIIKSIIDELQPSNIHRIFNDNKYSMNKQHLQLLIDNIGLALENKIVKPNFLLKTWKHDKHNKYYKHSGNRKQDIEKVCESIFIHIMHHYTAESYDAYADAFKCILPFIVKNEKLLEDNKLESKQIEKIMGEYMFENYGTKHECLSFIIKYKLVNNIDDYIYNVRYTDSLQNDEYFEYLQLFCESGLIEREKYDELCKEINDDFKKMTIKRLDTIEKQLKCIMEKLEIKIDDDEYD